MTISGAAGLIHELQRHFVLFNKEVVSTEGADFYERTFYQPTELSCEDADAVSKQLSAWGVKHKKDSHKITLPLGSLNLVYAKLLEGFGASFSVSSSRAKKVLYFGIREGEEHYFYGHYTEFIARMLKHSLVKDDSSILGYSCLCPISPGHIRSFSREHYNKLINQHIKRNPDNAVDQKRVIHFSKMPLEEALPVLLMIYQETPNPSLLQVIRLVKNVLESFLQDADASSPQHEDDLDRLNKYIEACQQVIQTPMHIGLVGGIASGKSTISRALEAKGYTVVTASDFIKAAILNEQTDATQAITRSDYFEKGTQMRREGGRGVVAQHVLAHLAANGITQFVVDGFRVPDEITYFKSIVTDFVVIGVDTNQKERIRRVLSRLRDIDSTEETDIVADIEREWRDPDPDGCHLEAVMEMCDFTISGEQAVEKTRETVYKLLKLT